MFPDLKKRDDETTESHLQRIEDRLSLAVYSVGPRDPETVALRGLFYHELGKINTTARGTAYDQG